MNFNNKLSLLLFSVLATGALEANRHQAAFECGYNAGADAARVFYACGQGNFNDYGAAREVQERAFGSFMWQHTRQQRDNMRYQRRQRRGSDAERYAAEHAWDVYNCHHQQRIDRTEVAIQRHFRTYEDVRYLFATLGCLSERMNINYFFTQGRYQPVQEFRRWLSQHPWRTDVLRCLDPGAPIDHVARDAYGNITFVPRNVGGPARNFYNCGGYRNNYNCSGYYDDYNCTYDNFYCGDYYHSTHYTCAAVYGCHNTYGCDFYNCDDEYYDDYGCGHNHRAEHYFNPNPFAGYQQVRFPYDYDYAYGFNCGREEPFSFECSAQQGFDEGWNVMQRYYTQLGCGAMHRNYEYNCGYGYNCYDPYNGGESEWEVRNRGLRQWRQRQRMPGLRRENSSDRLNDLARASDAYGCVHSRNIFGTCRRVQEHCRTYEDFCRFYDTLGCLMDQLDIRFDNLRRAARRELPEDSGTFPLVQSTRTWMQQHAQMGLSRDVLECAWGTDHAATDRYGNTIFENYPLNNLGCSPFGDRPYYYNNNYYRCNNYYNNGYFGCDEYSSDDEDDDFNRDW